MKFPFCMLFWVRLHHPLHFSSIPLSMVWYGSGTSTILQKRLLSCNSSCMLTLTSFLSLSSCRKPDGITDCDAAWWFSKNSRCTVVGYHLFVPSLRKQQQSRIRRWFLCEPAWPCVPRVISHITARLRCDAERPFLRTVVPTAEASRLPWWFAACGDEWWALQVMQKRRQEVLALSDSVIL